MTVRNVLPVVVALFAALLLSFNSPAADKAREEKNDLLDEAKRREIVTQQKVEADFRAAILELDRLAAKDPARAVERLQKVLSVLEEDTVLSEHKRAAWKRMLRDRIRALEAETRERAKEAEQQADKKVKTEERRTADDRRATEEEKLREGLNQVRRLQNEGKVEEAGRAAAELARRYPDRVAADASRRVTTTADFVRQYEELKRERDRRGAQVVLDTIRSSMPPRDDIEFPSPEKWREITKKRSKVAQMTEKEKAIMQALESPVNGSLKGMTLESAIDYLQTLTGVNFSVDKSTLDEAGVNYDTPINTRLRTVSLRTLLRKMLGDIGLTYIVKDESIQIVTPRQARETMTVRTYYLGDLAGVADFRLGPVFSQMQMQQTVNNLIQMIVGTIDPDSWAINGAGGKGQIGFDPRTLTLIIKQSAEVHYMLGGFGR